MCHVADRSILIARLDAEEFTQPRREPLDAELFVEKQDCDVRRSHQVFDVVASLRYFVELPLELVVHGLELFVDALELLLAGLELLCRGSIFFVEALKLLVRGAKVLVGEMVLVPRSISAPLGLPELLA